MSAERSKYTIAYDHLREKFTTPHDDVPDVKIPKLSRADCAEFIGIICSVANVSKDEIIDGIIKKVKP